SLQRAQGYGRPSTKSRHHGELRYRRNSCASPPPQTARDPPRGTRSGLEGISGQLQSTAHQKAVAERVNDRRQQDDAALDGENRCDRKAEQLQALVDHRQKENAKHRPQNLALATEQAD